MTKFKIFINIDKEESWINSIIAQGYRLTKASMGRYEFEKINTDDFLPLVRMDFRTFSKKQDFTDYLTLFEDAGWHHISGNRSEGNQYFERTRPDCQEEIFSDSVSKAGRYRRLCNMWMTLFAAYLPLVIIYSDAPSPAVNNWKELFYTPGLWELNGSRFWLAFLFELPFALGRALGGLFPFMLLIIVICFGYFSLQTFYWYRKERKR